MRIPDSVWIYLTLVGTTLLAGVGWTMLTNQFNWQQKLPAITITASLGLFLFSAAIHHWIETEKEEKLKRSQAEQRIIEDREEAEALANSIREETRLEKILNQERAETLREEQKARRRRGAIRNLYSFLFGDQ